mmetsp:Transcript_32748/g.82179  ORF Transcript_32748/g.82179 Transcript_32748/m.82179 type:complete len:135 (-) Transcript_32748:382-786(-)
MFSVEANSPLDVVPLKSIELTIFLGFQLILLYLMTWSMGIFIVGLFQLVCVVRLVLQSDSRYVLPAALLCSVNIFWRLLSEDFSPSANDTTLVFIGQAQPPSLFMCLLTNGVALLITLILGKMHTSTFALTSQV